MPQECDLGIMYRNIAVLAVLAGGRPDRMGFCGQDGGKPSTDGPPTDSGRPIDWGLVLLVCVEKPSAGVPESVGGGLPDDWDRTPIFLFCAGSMPATFENHPSHFAI